MDPSLHVQSIRIVVWMGKPLSVVWLSIWVKILEGLIMHVACTRT